MLCHESLLLYLILHCSLYFSTCSLYYTIWLTFTTIWILIEVNSHNLTILVEITSSIKYGPTYQSTSFFAGLFLNTKSFVFNITLSLFLFFHFFLSSVYLLFHLFLCFFQHYSNLILHSFYPFYKLHHLFYFFLLSYICSYP